MTFINTGGFRESFEEPKYDDAPYLSDQLLLPNLALGHDVHLFAAFAPSYIFRVVSDLAASPEVEPGFLNIVFYVPGDLTLRSSGIARFRNYLCKYASDENQVVDFVNNCLHLAEEGAKTGAGGIRISILHTSQKKPLSKGCLGIISSQSSTDDYVAFIDGKGGDFNSPVKPLRSWVDEQYFAAQGVLEKVTQASNGSHPRGQLVSDAEALDWLAYLANWYVDNPPEVKSEAALEEQTGVASDGTEGSTEIDDDGFLEYLQELQDFKDDENYGWIGDESNPEDLFQFENFEIVVPPSELEDGHIPPLPSSIAPLVGPATAVCPCGRVVVRANGCDAVSWDY